MGSVLRLLRGALGASLVWARCGGSPSGEVLLYEMRWDCARGRYELTVVHNRLPSLYAGTYAATRCACMGAQSVCPRIFAPDPCNP